MLTESRWGEIKDPVYGYVYISREEKKAVDSFPMQRLRRLRQMAGAEYVYPGANHTRFEHSIGALYLAQQLTGSFETSLYRLSSNSHVEEECIDGKRR